MFLPLSLLSILFQAVSASPLQRQAAQPCTDGTCTHQVELKGGSGSGILVLDGPADAIADLSETVGWHSWGCVANATSQNMRAVCTGEQSACDNVFIGGSATDKIVRLSDSCDFGPFARIAQSWEATNETVPDSVKGRIGNGVNAAKLYGFEIDHDYASIQGKGEVRFAIEVATHPGFESDLTPEALRSPGGFQARAPRPRSEQGWAEKAPILGTVWSWFKGLLGSVNDISTVNKGSANLNAVIPEQSLLNSPEVNATVKADITGVTNYAYSVVGTIIPPNLSGLSFYFGLSADVESSFTVDTNIQVHLDTGSIPIYSAQLSPLEIPGFISFGPSFQVSAQAEIGLTESTQSTIYANYHTPSLEFIWPEGHGSSIGDVQYIDKPLQLTWDTNASALGSLKERLTAEFDAGVTVFSGLAQAKLYVAQDIIPTLSGNVAAAASSEGAGALGEVSLNTELLGRGGVAGSIIGLLSKDWHINIYDKKFTPWTRSFSTGDTIHVNATTPEAEGTPTPLPADSSDWEVINSY